jgi:flagellar hook-length control protein FliK
VTPSSSPTNIQVQSSIASINSPELAKNFQNLVQILTRSGAGQAVLSNYLTQNKNNVANNNFEQALNQLPQTQNALGIQSVSVTSISESASANSALISNDGQNNSVANQTRLLNDSLGGQNIQLTAQNPRTQNNGQVQTDAFTANVQIPVVPIGANTLQTPIQSSSTQPIQPTTPVVPNVAQNVPSQSVIPAVNTQNAQAFDVITAGQNNQSQSVANPNSQEALSQPQDVFSNGHLQALNGIVARFNNAVVSGQATDPNVINYINNINQYPSETQAENKVLNQAATVQTISPALKIEPVTQTVNAATDIVLNNQNTQQANNLTSNNVQNQLVQPTSPTTQQVTNIINNSAQNSFVQTGANTPVTNLINGVVGTTTLNTANSSSTTVNPSTSVISSAPAVQQIETTNQSTVVVNPSSSSASSAPVTLASSSPVVTQPVTNPASMTAQNVPAATIAGETAKASVPVLILSNPNNNNNAPAVSAVSSVSAASSVQPVTAQAVSQASNTSETLTNLNTAGNFNKNTLSDSADLQNLAAAVNAGVTVTTDKTSNAFQNTVNTVANRNPNGSVDSAQILNQITQQVASQTADAKMVNRLSFQLVPESLGRVTVQVALVDQAISARIVVSNPDVREVLQQHMVDLKAALSQAGLQIDQMQVQVQGGGANLLNQYFQYQQEGNSYRESAWTPSNIPEIAQNSDNSSLLATAGSSSLNFLV